MPMRSATRPTTLGTPPFTQTFFTIAFESEGRFVFPIMEENAPSRPSTCSMAPFRVPVPRDSHAAVSSSMPASRKERKSWPCMTAAPVASLSPSAITARMVCLLASESPRRPAKPAAPAAMPPEAAPVMARRPM